MAKRRVGLTQRLRILSKAQRSKRNKYTGSGLVVILAGCILIGIYSSNSLLLGLGVLVVILGIIRLLIGLINPTSPVDLLTREEGGEDANRDSLDRQLFPYDGDVDNM